MAKKYLMQVKIFYLVISVMVGYQLQDQSEEPLGDLFLAKSGGLAHYSSYDKSGNNADFRTIAPGETLVLVDHKGAGVLRRW